MRVEPALADDHGALASIRASKSIASSTNAAPGDELGAERRPQPAGEPAGRAAHRHARAGQRRSAAQRERFRAAAPSRGRRPSAARTRAAASLERRAHVAEHRQPRAAQPPGRARSPRSRPRRRRSSRCRRRATSTCAAPASTAAAISSPVPALDAASASRSPAATSARPLAAATSTQRRALAVAEQREARARPARPSGSLAAAATTRRRARASSTSIVPSPPSATGARSARQAGAREPATDRRARPRRRQRALEGVGRDEHRSVAQGHRAPFSQAMAQAAEAITIEAAGREVRISNPGKVFFPEPGLHQARPRQLLPRVRGGGRAPPARAPTTMKRWVDGVDGRVLLPEARARHRARVADHGDGALPERALRARARRLRRGAPRVGRQPRRDRLEPLAGAPARPRPSRRAARRSRPHAGGRLRRGARRRAVRRARCSRSTGSSASRRRRGSRGIHVNVRIQPAARLRRGSPRGARARARGRAAHARSRDEQVVEGGARRRLRRLQPERPRSHRRLRLLGSRRAGRARVVPVEWDELATSTRRALRLDTVPARLRERGDPSRRSTRTPGSLDSLLELAARDAANGLGDAPWPPNFPKAPRRGDAAWRPAAPRRVSRDRVRRAQRSWSTVHSRGGLSSRQRTILRAVADAAVADVVVADLDDQLGPQRDPFEVALGASSGSARRCRARRSHTARARHAARACAPPRTPRCGRPGAARRPARRARGSASRRFRASTPGR